MSFFAGLIGAGGSIAGQAINDGAQVDALDKMIKAYQNLKLIDPAALQSIMISGDKAQYVNSVDFARQQNPELYAARQQGAASLAKLVGNDLPVLTAMKGLESIMSENTDQQQAIEKTLRDKAQEQLSLGSKLDPTFQQELVRAGLESGGATGVGTGGTGPLAQLLGNKIGAAGVALEQQRLQTATALSSAADALKANRSSILQGGTASLLSSTNALAGLDLTALNAFHAMTPTIGPSGTVNAAMTDELRNEQNNQALALAGLLGKKDIANAAWLANIVKGSTSAISGGLGGTGGGAGGSSGGWLSGLFGGGAPSTTGQYSLASSQPTS